MDQVASLKALVGKTLGLYRLEKLLSYGGMAAVYQSVHEQLARIVAVKVLLPSLVLGPPRVSFLDRFRDEARMIATLNHPNILPVYDFGIQDGIAYLVMHYANGGSLYDRLNSSKGGGPLPLDEAAHYLAQAAAALDHAHQKGIVHRDVKPHNFLLEERHLMLGDFGIARLVAGNDENDEASAPTLTSGAPVIRGTPLYLSPEQGRGEPVDWRADIYALGVTLYQMLSGQVPFNDPAGAWPIIMKHVSEAPPPLAGQRGVTREIEAVVMKALAKQPKDRYQSAGAFAAAFRAALGSIPKGTPQPATSASQQSGSGKMRSMRAAGRTCPKCGLVNRPDAKFCLKDGARLPITTVRQWDDEEEFVRICPTCGFLNRPRAKYCLKDGMQLASMKSSVSQR
jgi:serine/threonine protein kinase